jgi:hypothetical protein
MSIAMIDILIWIDFLILISCGIVYVILLYRNDRVRDYIIMTLLNDLIREDKVYPKLPSYDTMVMKFWVWPIHKFAEEKNDEFFKTFI